MAVLEREEWEKLRTAHQSRLRPWTEDRVTRSARHIGHPVFDFLFEYYSFRPAYLLRWSPGIDVELRNTDPCDTDWPEHFTPGQSGTALDVSFIPAHRIPFLEWVTTYLSRIDERQPVFSCFGLHEWAMLYSDGPVRYSYAPLRLPREEIVKVVNTFPLRCTHYDAYRFFTPLALPKNRHTLSRQTTSDFDQPGCVHVAMDLYKFAHKIAPFTSAEIIADTFLLAGKARVLDMRASPYDLTTFGFEPLAIETAAGREEYVALQRALSEEARPLRLKLLQELTLIRERIKANSKRDWAA